MPAEEKYLLALVRLARLISKCAARIYNQRHESLLHMWNAATELRHELQAYVEQQLYEVHLDIQGEPGTGECGFCKTIMASSMSRNTIWSFLFASEKLTESPPSLSVSPCSAINVPPLPRA